jgi:methylated-DNA-[protein]-cysteine S-methyltransferase
MTVYTTIESPIGELLATGDGTALSTLSFADRVKVLPGWRHEPAAFEELERQLRAYFAGDLDRFELVTASTGTPFQERVWAALESIPYGTTTTYGRLAEQLGAPRDRIRAVGAAIGANPLLIVRPCHRVVGADGSMTGYAGGVERKHFLLGHEGALQPQLG